MYAIIQEGGRQFKVTSGDRIQIDREYVADQKELTFDQVLLVGGDGDAKVGTPLVKGATVTAEVLGPTKGPKVEIVKYKRRKGFHKRTGHRQKYLDVKITAINA
jgi:large subunit ribosomal protein L21